MVQVVVWCWPGKAKAVTVYQQAELHSNEQGMLGAESLLLQPAPPWLIDEEDLNTLNRNTFRERNE